MPRKKNTSTTITLSTKAGDIAKARVPGQCYLANNLRTQGATAPKVTAKDVRLTLTEDNALVKQGKYEAGTRLIIPSPRELAYYIGNVEQGSVLGAEMVAQEDAAFVLDVDSPDVKVIPPAQVGPRGGVRGDRAQETAAAKQNPNRAAQMRNAGQRFAIRAKNAELTRCGKAAMTSEQIEAHLISLGL